MPKVPRRLDLGRELNDYGRRLRDLEGGERVGINRYSHVRQTGFPTSASTYGAWTTGPVGATWRTREGGTGTGWPQITCRVRSVVDVSFSCIVTRIGVDTTTNQWKASNIDIGFGVDGGDPEAFPGASDYNPSATRLLLNNNVNSVSIPVSWTGPYELPSGDHTFQVWSRAFIGNGLGAQDPQIGNISLKVIPLD